MNKGAIHGNKSLAAHVGITFDIVLRTDASAALGVVNRRSVGKTRHTVTQEMRLQSAMSWRCRRSARRTSLAYSQRT